LGKHLVNTVSLRIGRSLFSPRKDTPDGGWGAADPNSTRDLGFAEASVKGWRRPFSASAQDRPECDRCSSNGGRLTCHRCRWPPSGSFFN